MLPDLKATTAALALLALGLAAAPAASAEQFHTEVNPPNQSVITGANLGSQTFTFAESSVECSSAALAGTQSQSTAGQLTLHPTYSECILGGVVPATVTTTGCNYVLSDETTENPDTASLDAPLSIECEEGHALYIEAAKCKLTLDTPQTVHGLEYENEGSGAARDVTAAASLSTISWEAENTAGVGLKCGTLGIPIGETGEEGSYEGAFTLKAYEDECEAEECPFVPESGADADAYTEGEQRGLWWDEAAE